MAKSRTGSFGELQKLLSSLAQKLSTIYPQGPQPQGAPPPSFNQKMVDAFGQLADKLSKRAGVGEKVVQSGAPRSFGQAVTSDTVEEGGAKLLKGLGEIGGMLGPAGKIFQGFTKLGEALLTSIDALRKWDKELIDANLKFSEFSEAMTYVKVQQQIRDLELSRMKGQGQAGTAKDLADSVYELNMKMAPYEIAFANFKNELFSYLTQVVTNTGGFLQTIAPVPSALLQLLASVQKGEQDTSFQDYFFAQGKKSIEEFDRPGRFKGRD